jgi:hypothetical protein
MKVHDVAITAHRLQEASDDLRACLAPLSALLEDPIRLNAGSTWIGPAADALAAALEQCQGEVLAVWVHVAGRSADLAEQATTLRLAGSP